MVRSAGPVHVVGVADATCCNAAHHGATRHKIVQRTMLHPAHQGATRYKIVQRAVLQRDATQVVGVADTGVKADECFFRDASVAVPYNTVNQAHRKIVQCGPPTDSATRVCRITYTAAASGTRGYPMGPPQVIPSLTPRDGALRIPISDQLCRFCLAVPVGKLSALKPFVAAARQLVCARDRAVSAPGSGRICSVYRTTGR